MVWEWVAPTATAIVGVAGTTGTVLVAMIGRRHAEKVAAQAAENAVRTKRIERQDEALRDACCHMQTKMLKLAGEHFSHLTTEAADDIVEELYKVASIVTLYGNRKLATLVGDWLGISQSITSMRGIGVSDENREELNELLEKSSRVMYEFSTEVRHLLGIAKD